MIQSLRDGFDHERQLPHELVTAVGARLDFSVCGFLTHCAAGARPD
jgi:hypothetical protein